MKFQFKGLILSDLNGTRTGPGLAARECTRYSTRISDVFQ
jgi:hypothetical protein